MTSRKYFLGITAMMLVLFFMFMFSEIVKSSDRDFDVNGYAKVTPIVHKENERDASAVKVQYTGDSTSLRSGVSAWCRYTKKNYVEDGAAIIVVDSKSLNADKIEELEKKANEGVILIFAGFPDADLLAKNNALKTLMGVSEVKGTTNLLGAYLYSGFLLGGEKQYLPEKDNKKEEAYQDLTLTLPWIVTGKGTKVYMSGIIEHDGDELVPQGSPALIWRAVTDKTVAFVIYDDFIENQSIYGVLEACVYDASDFTLCPVVNASMFTVSDFALLSEENTEKIQSIYSRSTQSLVKEIIWPRLESYAKRENIIYSCYFNTRLDKTTENLVQTSFSFFLREMREISAEAGISGNTINDTLSQKLPSDLAFYSGTGSSYTFTSIYLEKLASGDIKAINDAASKLYSLVLKDKGDCDYIDATDSIIINAVTQDANSYSYKADFAYRSLATAVGYSNLLIDIKRIMQPETEADQWQNYAEVLSGNLSDYWSKLSVFEGVSASEAAKRTAAYMNNTALCTRKGRTITIAGAEPGYFLLRTHGEVISDIKNASFTFLEKDAYLITITNNEKVEITVE